MAIILDIAGKPLPPRKRAKRRLRAQDIRDLLKICIVLLLIISGYFAFAPAESARSQSENVPAQASRNA
nr:hypothetical protein [uncultured Sphingorhabdus sp.]